MVIAMALVGLSFFPLNVAAIEPSVGFISFEVSLGDNAGSIPLGQIGIRLTSLGPESYTPAAVEFYSSPLSDEVEVLKEGATLRQLKYSTGLIDVVRDDKAYEIRFYNNDSNGPLAKVYPIYADAVPLIVYRFFNPGDLNGQPRLIVTDTRPAKPVAYTLFTQERNKSWSMEKGALKDGQPIPAYRQNLLKTVLNDQPLKVLSSEDLSGAPGVVLKSEYETHADPLYAGRLQATEGLDGVCETYDYVRGDYDATTSPPSFSPGIEGRFLQTAITYTRVSDRGALVANASKRVSTVTSYRRYSASEIPAVLMEKSEVYDGSEFKTVSISADAFNTQGQRILSVKNNRLVYAALWYDRYQMWEVVEDGSALGWTYNVYYKFRGAPAPSDTVNHYEITHYASPALTGVLGGSAGKPFDRTDPWARVLLDDEVGLRLPYLTPQPSLTRLENRVLAESTQELLNDVEFAAFHHQIRVLLQQRKSLFYEKLLLNYPRAAAIQKEMVARQARLQGQSSVIHDSILKDDQSPAESATDSSPISIAQQHRLLGTAMKEVSRDPEVVALQARIKDLSDQRDGMIERKLNDINPSAANLYTRVKEGYEKAVAEKSARP